MTGSKSVNSRKEVILTSTGKEYTIERLTGKSLSTETLLSQISIEEDKEVSE